MSPLWKGNNRLKIWNICENPPATRKGPKDKINGITVIIPILTSFLILFRVKWSSNIYYLMMQTKKANAEYR